MIARGASLREIRANLRVVVLAAVLLVVVATAATIAAVGHALGLSWPVAWVLGARLDRREIADDDRPRAARDSTGGPGSAGNHRDEAVTVDAEQVVGAA